MKSLGTRLGGVPRVGRVDRDPAVYLGRPLRRPEFAMMTAQGTDGTSTMSW